MRLAEMHAAELITGELHLHLSGPPFASPDEAAVRLHLKPIGESWRRVDRDTAHHILGYLLREDMAFSLERMPADIAEAEAAEFLSKFSSEARAYTNGNWKKAGRSPGVEAHAARAGNPPPTPPLTEASLSP